jgi:hypothetical protein
LLTDRVAVDACWATVARIPPMKTAEASLDEQVVELERIVRLNPVVVAILERCQRLGSPTAGLLPARCFKPSGTFLCGRDPRAGILDYDVNYFDSHDLSWEAEDTAIRAAATTMASWSRPSRRRSVPFEQL